MQNSIFVGPTATEGITHVFAQTVMRSAFGEAAKEPPPKELTAAIRAGAIIGVGWAVLRSTVEVQLTASKGVGHGGGDFAVIAAALAGGAPGSQPIVTSAAKFSHAVFSVILPALMDLPTASLHWMALASTVLELYFKALPTYGESQAWTMANTYLIELLTERVLNGDGFAVPSIACLNVYHLTSMNAISKGAAGPQAGRKGGACNGFNHQNGCPRGEACDYRHVCSVCYKGGHNLLNCGQSAGAAGPQRAGGSGGGNRNRSNRGGRGGSSGAASSSAAAASAH